MIYGSEEQKLELAFQPQISVLISEKNSKKVVHGHQPNLTTIETCCPLTL